MANDAHHSRTHRVVTAAFGALFTVLALAIVVVSDRTVGPLLLAVLLGILGIDAMVGAYRSRPSLLSRIGPLP